MADTVTTYHLAGIINRNNNGDDDDRTGLYTNLPATPTFTTPAAARSFRNNVVLSSEDNKVFYRCAPNGESTFDQDHIVVIKKVLTIEEEP